MDDLEILKAHIRKLEWKLEDIRTLSKHWKVHAEGAGLMEAARDKLNACIYELDYVLDDPCQK